MHGLWETSGITLNRIHQWKWPEVAFGSDWEHAFEANLLIAAIYCTPGCIAKPSRSMQTGFPPDEAKIIPGSEPSALHLLMGLAGSN